MRRLRHVRRDGVEDALQFLDVVALLLLLLLLLLLAAGRGRGRRRRRRRDFGQALGEQRLQDREVLADVDVVVELGVGLLFGGRFGHVAQELLHGGGLVFEEVVHEFHEILFALETREVGQRLQRLGDQRQIARRLLARIFCSIQ